MPGRATPRPASRRAPEPWPRAPPEPALPLAEPDPAMADPLPDPGLRSLPAEPRPIRRPRQPLFSGVVEEPDCPTARGNTPRKSGLAPLPARPLGRHPAPPAARDPS